MDVERFRPNITEVLRVADRGLDHEHSRERLRNHLAISRSEAVALFSIGIAILVIAQRIPNWGGIVFLGLGSLLVTAGGVVTLRMSKSARDLA